MTAPVRIQWLHANDVGISRFDTFDIEREETVFAPPAGPFPVSKLIPASRFAVVQLSVGWSGERHPTPARQILFCLAGSVRVTPGAGQPVTVNTCEAWLMEDTTGGRHQTQVTSDVPFEAVIIRLPDDARFNHAV